MDDRAIVGGLRQGSPEALAALSDRYRPCLVAYARKVLRDPMEAEDVAQETLMKADGISIEADGSLAGWLYTAAYRLSVDRIRRRGREARLQPLPDAAAAVETAARRDELGQAQAALHALDEPYRTALSLRYLESLEFPEIAQRMGTIERTARTWVGRGLTMLRKRLGGAE